MKQALVLAGGGAKGAYEAGCIKALKELGYTFDIVCGTSIGAMNGLMVKQRGEEALFDMWENLTIDKVMAGTVSVHSLEDMLNQKNRVTSFFKTYMDEKGVDITPLKDMMHGMFHAQEAKDSGIQYGVVTVEFPSLKAVEITDDEMEAEELVEYAIASGSCFPAFPVHKIGETGYIDGGYCDNLPISLAIRMGADKVIAIELNTEYTHEHFANRPMIDIIRPYRSLGGFLDFDNDVLNQRMQQGYYDTKKHLGKLYGYYYTFEKESFNKTFASLFYKAVLYYEDEINRPIRNKIVSTNMTPVGDYVKKYTKKETLEMEDYFICALEQFFTFDNKEDGFYTWKDVKSYLEEKVDSMVPTNKVMTLLTEMMASEELSSYSHQQMIAYFYHRLLDNQDGFFTKAFIYDRFIKEFICALLLYVTKTLKENK